MAKDKDQTVIKNEIIDTNTAGKETANITRDKYQDSNDHQLTDEEFEADTKPTGVAYPTAVAYQK